MNTMNMPGFTAENSIYGSREHYDVVTTFDSQNSAANVQPAVSKLCLILSDLVWGAYNEGAYNRAEFWSNVMESGGCFN